MNIQPRLLSYVINGIVAHERFNELQLPVRTALRAMNKVQQPLPSRYIRELWDYLHGRRQIKPQLQQPRLLTADLIELHQSKYRRRRAVGNDNVEEEEKTVKCVPKYLSDSFSFDDFETFKTFHTSSLSNPEPDSMARATEAWQLQWQQTSADLPPKTVVEPSPVAEYPLELEVGLIAALSDSLFGPPAQMHS